jgi:hypothetical protein
MWLMTCQFQQSPKEFGNWCCFNGISTTIFKVYYLERKLVTPPKSRKWLIVWMYLLWLCLCTILALICTNYLQYWFVTIWIQLCKLIIFPSYIPTHSFFVRIRKCALGLQFIAKLKKSKRFLIFNII